MRMGELGVRKREGGGTGSSYSLPTFFFSVKEEEMYDYQTSGKEEDTIGVEKELLKLSNDWVFKRVFSDKNCGTSLSFLLRTILQIDFKSIEFIPQEVPREDKDSKTVIYDISVKLDDGTCVDIEMQPLFHAGLIERILFYGTRLMSLKKGENNYHTLNKSVVITFINDSKHFFPDTISGYVLGEWKREPSHILTDKLIYYFIDMKRIDHIEICKENEDLITLLKFITCTRREEMEALVQKNKNLKQAGDTLAHISQDPAERAFADAREKFLWDQEVREGRAREEGVRPDQVIV